MSDALTLGVLGHVDHGKTALVRALTGIETDRLREERERGLSIVLGFAYIETAHGVVDLIDVPGHEDFIRAMIGGATALDGVILCIAANEGVKPQTVEHFRIAELLGVERGCVVLTKADLVAPDTLAAVRTELESFLHDSFLAGAPVIAASGTTGEGIDVVREAVSALAARPVARDADGPFFLPLDRVFTVRGFGQVVTGTLRRGPLAVGDTVEIQPAGRSATVRGLQNHGRPIERALPGQRVAVNLRHVDRDALHRGDVLTAPGSMAPAKRMDAQLRVLGDATAGMTNGATVRLLTGTTEAMARIRLLDRREIAPGETAMVQLNLDRAIATRAAEPFLVRSVSPMQTLGGGTILEVNPRRHRRFDTDVTRRLETVASGDLRLIVARRLAEAGAAGVRLGPLADELGLARAALDPVVAELDSIAVGDGLIVAAAVYDAVLAEIVAAIEHCHAREPLRSGIDAGNLVNELASRPGPEVLQHAVRRLVEQQRIRSGNGTLSMAGHDPFAKLGERERELAGAIERVFLKGGLEPPAPQTVLGADRARHILYRLLLDTGRVVRLRTYERDSEIVLHAKVLEAARQAIERSFPSPAAFAVKDIRDLLGSTRRHVLPLMEHLDTTGVTVRNGDLRRLREPRP